MQENGSDPRVCGTGHGTHEHRAGRERGRETARQGDLLCGE